MTPPARVDEPSASETRGGACEQLAGYQHDETHLERDLATVRALRSAGVEDVALLAAGLGQESLDAIRGALRTFRKLSGLPAVPAAPPRSEHS